MVYGDYYWGFYGDYYRDPFPHSLLSTRQDWRAINHDPRGAWGPHVLEDQRL